MEDSTEEGGPSGRRHTEESKRKMSDSHKAGFADGSRTGQNKHNEDKTRCSADHEYDEENTYRRPDGGRDCKKCMRKRTRESREKRAQEKPPKPPRGRVAKGRSGPAVVPDWRPGSPGRAEYDRLHLHNRRTRGSASLYKCVLCAERGVDKQAREWSWVHGTDYTNPDEHFRALCGSCHRIYDEHPGDPEIGQRRAAQQHAKTHCPAGHEYTPENTYILQRSGGRTARQCKTCTREKAAKRKKD